MAGAGYKLFVNGNTLSASDLNTYVQQQTVMVFASTSARDTALSGVLAEGMQCYITGTGGFYYNGSAWVANVTASSTTTFTNKTLNLTPTAGTSATAGVLNVGTNSFSDTGLLATFQSSIAGYNQVTVQNTSSNAAASAEFVAYADNGTATTNYAAVGMNSSTYTGTGALNAAGAGFLLTGSTDLALGTIGANAIHIVANSQAADAITISALNVPTLKSPKEITTVSATAATGTINFDSITQGVLYYTTNASANFTLNLRGNSTTTLASTMATGDAWTGVFLNTNGATPYYPTAYQIDGSAVTPKWQGGTAPTGGNASAIDAYTITVIKTSATPTYTVIAAQTKFA